MFDEAGTWSVKMVQEVESYESQGVSCIAISIVCASPYHERTTIASHKP